MEKRAYVLAQKLISMGIEFIAFDADDTLWVNEPFFREAEEKFIKLLSKNTDSSLILDELYNREIKNLALYGYGIKGFVPEFNKVFRNILKSLQEIYRTSRVKVKHS